MSRILLLRSIPLDRDSRSSRMARQYELHDYGVQPLVWTRGEATSEPSGWSFSGSGGYGRGFGGFLPRLRFAAFIVSTMIRRRQDYEIVHAVDFDTGSIAVPLARLLRKTVVYDAFDHVGAIIANRVIGRFFASLERMLIRWSDLAIFPEPIRLRQYGLRPEAKIYFISNIPDRADIPIAGPVHDFAGPLTIAYVGTLEARHRALEWIGDLCDRFPDIRWTVAWLGALESEMQRFSQEHENLIFVGQVSYQDALEILQAADCHLGCYLLSAPAHEFAAPNKVYEHLALGRALITNRGTPAGDLVATHDTGFVFNGTIDGLEEVLGQLARETCRMKGANARRAWDETFAGKREAQLEEYFDALAETLAPARAR